MVILYASKAKIKLKKQVSIVKSVSELEVIVRGK